MKLAKGQLDELREEYAKVWGEGSDMVDWSVKNASCAMYFRGYIVDLRKPHIETRFCFGEHGYDFDEVVDECEQARKSERFFIKQNIDRTEAKGWLDMLDGATYSLRHYVPILAPQRYGCGETRLAGITWTDDISAAREDPMALTEEEIAQMRDVLVEELEKFDKRLHTYLKRYGLSKCQYWTYWADR